MHIGDALNTITKAERAACPITLRQAVMSARTPIEAWRATDVGHTLERELADTLKQPEADKPSGFSHVLGKFASWLPPYITAMFAHAASDTMWQPPLTDFATEKHTGLYLIERADLKLSVILLRSICQLPVPKPAIIRRTTGHVMLKTVTADTHLTFRRWQRDEAKDGTQMVPMPDTILHPCETLHCQLSGQFMQPLPNKPTLVLRLEWPEEQRHPDRYYDATTGSAMPHMMGSDGFRRHMALSALSSLMPDTAADYLPQAIAEAPDDALAWHYCRQLLAIAPEVALPILRHQSEAGSAAMRKLAWQTLSILRAHYAQVFEAV
jgi:hypothetical protein